jgi:hypothetical protein
LLIEIEMRMKLLTGRPAVYFLTVLLSVLLIVLTILLVRTTNELHTFKTEYDQVVKNHEKKIEELTAQALAGKNHTANNINLISFFIERFKEKGLSNPVQDIVSDLMKHPELIPYKAKAGGEMHFYEKEIWILNEKWVYAYFEDGHFAGYLLLEYSISDEGKINWKRIASMI